MKTFPFVTNMAYNKEIEIALINPTLFLPHILFSQEVY